MWLRTSSTCVVPNDGDQSALHIKCECKCNGWPRRGRARRGDCTVIGVRTWQTGHGMGSQSCLRSLWTRGSTDPADVMPFSPSSLQMVVDQTERAAARRRLLVGHGLGQKSPFDMAYPAETSTSRGRSGGTAVSPDVRGGCCDRAILCIRASNNNLCSAGPTGGSSGRPTRPVRAQDPRTRRSRTSEGGVERASEARERPTGISGGSDSAKNTRFMAHAF